jgi:L-rhamnose isomerase
MSAYDYAKSIYHNIGVDTDLAIEELKKISLSLQCWQGDDVKGFLFGEQELTGGIQVTGAYPYRARTPEELRNDLKFALSLIGYLGRKNKRLGLILIQHVFHIQNQTLDLP